MRNIRNWQDLCVILGLLEDFQSEHDLFITLLILYSLKYSDLKVLGSIALKASLDGGYFPRDDNER